ncbi:hypothetical protein D3C78_511880 [compost metagenome]
MQADPQPGDAGIQMNYVRRPAHSLDQIQRQLVLLLDVHRLQRLALPPRGLEVELADEEAEQAEIEQRPERPNDQEPPGVVGLGQVQVEEELQGAMGEVGAVHYPQIVGQREGHPGQQGVDHIEHGSHEQEGELHRFGDPGQPGGEGRRQHQPPHQLAFLRAGAAIDRQSRGRQGPHGIHVSTGQTTGTGIPLEEAHQLPGHHLPGLGIGPAAQLVEEEGIPDMVQAGRDQGAFHQAIEAEGDRLVQGAQVGGELEDGAAHHGPDEAEHYPEEDAAKAGDDGHETLAGEEAQVFGQLQGVEAIEEVGRQGSHQDAAEDPHVEGRNAQHLCVGLQAAQHYRLAEGRIHGDEAHHGGQGGGAVVVAGKADGDADQKQQRHVAEDPVPRHHEHAPEGGGQEEVPLGTEVANPQHQAGGRQGRHGEHQAAPDPLRLGKK